MKAAMNRWWSWGGALLGIALLAYVLARIDYARFAETLARARGDYLALVPLAIALEQVVRAWKWRQLLHPLRPVATARLFGAIMAGYLGAMLVPGASPLLRAWLVARLESLRMSALLATVAIDRLVDGVVFTLLVATVLAAAIFPDPGGRIQLGLAVGGAGSLALFGALLWLLARYKRAARRADGWTERLAVRLPQRLQPTARRIAASFADGIVWPQARWRQAGIVAASLAMKLIAATHFLFAGLGFGVLLAPLDYLFLIVFLGFIVILTHFVRLAGGFILGAIFALGLFGVAEEQALAMVLTVQLASLATVAAIGALALWRYGVAFSELRELAGERR